MDSTNAFSLWSLSANEAYILKVANIYDIAVPVSLAQSFKEMGALYYTQV